MIFKGILLLIGTLIFGYIIGSIPTAVIISKTFKHYDIRDYGSHNAGGTNVGRVMGKKYGVLVIALDMLKIALAIWTTYFLVTSTSLSQYCLNSQPAYYYYSIAITTSIGHCFPIFASFKGGKAVATFYGALLSFSPLLSLVAALTFFIILKIKKYVSLASILSSVLAALCSLLILIPSINKYFLYPCLTPHFLFAIVITLLSLFLIRRHRENIKRLKNGNESKIKWMK